MEAAIALLSAANIVLVVVMFFMAKAFLRELRGLLDYQDRLLDRVQAPEAGAASAASRLFPQRTPRPKRQYVRGRGGVRVGIPVKDDGDVDEEAT